MPRTHITTVINGDETEFLTEDSTSLLNALRDEVGLTGAKEGCGTGDCGACSILVDDRVNCACLMFAPEADGTVIETVEGLADSGELHPLQQCFLEGAALQCGICTPGMLMTATDMLRKYSLESDEEIRDGLSGNICRCTGYQHIVDAVRSAAAKRDDAS